MCKFIVIFNKNKNNNAKIQQILDANYSSLKSQRDGYSIMKVGENGKVKTERGLDYNKFSPMYEGEPVFAVHTRIKTTGEVSESNTHLKEIYGRYYFAHNGWITGLRETKDMTDSEAFFRLMLAPQAKGMGLIATQEMVDTHSFSGRGFIYDKAAKRACVFATNEIYLYALPDCLIFATYELEDEIYEHIPDVTLGFDFGETKKVGTIEFKNHEKIEECYFFLKDGVVKLTDKLEKQKKYNSGNYYTANKHQTPLPYRVDGVSEEEQLEGVFGDYFIDDNGSKVPVNELVEL